MNHETALNLLLANACARDEVKADNAAHYGVSVEDLDKDLRVFEFDLHCATARVVAELISTLGSIQYRIVSVKLLEG